MFPYPIYQLVAEERIRDRICEARRHDLLAEARHHERAAMAQAASTGPSSLRNAVAHLVGLVHVPRRAAAAGTRTVSTRPAPRPAPKASAPTAGPMGCVA